jgi:hypothetical protein
MGCTRHSRPDGEDENSCPTCTWKGAAIACPVFMLIAWLLYLGIVHLGISLTGLGTVVIIVGWALVYGWAQSVNRRP